MGYGFVAALCWGISALLGALVSRRLGSLKTASFGHATGVACLTLLLGLDPNRLRFSGGSVVALSIAGILVAVAFLAIYRGLAVGPVAVVTPIAAGYAAVDAVLAIVFLGERPSTPAVGGIVAVVSGVVLSSTDLGERSWRKQTRASGIPFAVTAMGAFGVATFIVGYYSKQLGWFESVYLSRLGSLATLAATFAIARPRTLPGGGSWPLVTAGVVGILDVIAFSAYARGSEVGPVTLVAVISATNPLIPVIGGVVLFHERIGFGRILGLALVGVGVMLLAAEG